MRAIGRNPFLVGAGATLVIATVAVVLLLTGGGRSSKHVQQASACARGLIREHDTGTAPGNPAVAESKVAVAADTAPKGADAKPPSGDNQDHSQIGDCSRLGHPETYADLLQANGERVSRSVAPGVAVAPGAYQHALAQRDSLRSAAASAAVPGADGTWTPLGTTPEVANNTSYDTTNGSTQEGFVNLSGRISDFDRNPTTGALYAAASNGGVWESDDHAVSWHSIGDTLPSQVVSSIKYSSAAGGTLLVLTGDNAFGFDSLSGLGAYRSTDGGAHWTQASGIPSGVLGFKLAVDPAHPDIVYAATGAGLFRSTDDGQSFTNVMLPTGNATPGAPSGSSCAGHTLDFTTADYKDCFLANEVTDVVVQGPANAATGASAAPGAVVAAVGWRAGQKHNADGAQQSPTNGIYISSDGAPNSFSYVNTAASGLGGGNPAPGMGSQTAIGRVALGIANGPAQNHQILYALVEDANRFDGRQSPDDLDSLPNGAPGSNVFNGVYVSTDFGHTWTLLEDANTLTNDLTSGSALVPAGAALGYQPGVQSWYNEWITPDPTTQVDDPAGPKGVPTRLLFGLEEIWENKLGSSPQPLDGMAPANPPGSTRFDVIGRYWNSCDFVANGAPKCGPGHGNNNVQPNTTTTHPDQHAGFAFPDGTGGVSLLVGNDGGAYLQTAPANGDFSNNNWGNGNNTNLHTLQAYDAEMAKDGTVYAGLQDNGQLKILPDGRQYEIFGGDAFFTAVDPNNANVNYEEYTGGNMSVTTDGGATWTNESPTLVSPQFSTPFLMDPTDSNHLMIGGRNIEETASGPTTVSCGDPSCATVNNNWTQVYDLGTQKQRGDATATASATDPNNQLSALDLSGDNAYVGFCGYCDTITQPVTAAAPFANGIATNVGGTLPPKRLTSQGWHIAAATGLPNRYITSVAIDPANPSTVYVALAGYGRHWAVPGAVGDDVSKVGTGHVFRSTDAGNSFTDVSGDLPDVPADSVILRNGQLVVGTDIGVFASTDTAGSHWAVLGSGLATVPVSHLAMRSGDANTLVVATYGRGVYTYAFPTTASPAGASPGTPAGGFPGGVTQVVPGSAPAGATNANNACVAVRRLVYRVNRVPGGRVVSVAVYALTRGRYRRVLVRRGHSVRSVSIARPPATNFTIKIISTNNRGGQVITTRAYRNCTQTRVRGHVKRHGATARSGRRA